MNYTTQMDAAKKGIITPEMEIVAKKENITAEELRERVARGSVAIPANKMHKAISPEGVGEGLKTKINVNLGISKDCTDYSIEWEKVKMAVDMKAEAIMDLSCYGKTHEFRQKLIDECPAMIGTVPMYDAVGYLDKELADITADEFLEVIEAHAKEGVDFMTIHAGINRRTAQIFKESGGRLTNIVSRGGSLIFAWMEMTGNENPFFEYYDKVLDILAKYDAKATFFVTGRNQDYNYLIKDAYNAGHTIALHTYSHEYSTVYASVDAYFDDLNKVGQMVKKEIGFVPHYIRFPGGSSNTVSRRYCQGIMSTLTKEVVEKGYQYYDWNGDSTDASGNHVAVDKLIRNGTSCHDNNVMILCHDTQAKDTTVQALPAIIEHYKNLGYTFKGIDDATYAPHQSVNN